MATTEQNNNKQTLLSDILLEVAGEYNFNLNDFSCDVVDFKGRANNRDIVKVRVDGGSKTYRTETDDWTHSNRSGTVREVMVLRKTVSTEITPDDMASGIKFKNMARILAKDFISGLNADIQAAIIKGVQEGKVKFHNAGAEDAFTYASLRPIAKAIIKPNELPTLSIKPTSVIDLMPQKRDEFGLKETGLFSKIVPVTVEDSHILGYAGYKKSLCVACATPAELDSGLEFKTQLEITLEDNGLRVMYTEYQDTLGRRLYAAIDAMVGIEIGTPNELLLIGTDSTYQPALASEMEISTKKITTTATGETATITVKSLAPVEIESAPAWITATGSAEKNDTTGVYTTTISAVIAAYTKKNHGRFGSIMISDGKTFEGIAVEQKPVDAAHNFILPTPAQD